MELEKYINWESIKIVFDQLVNAIMIVDRDGVILYTNVNYVRMYDMDMECFQKKYWGNRIRSANAIKELLKVVETGKPLLNQPHIMEKPGYESIINIIPIKQGDYVVGAIYIGSNPMVANIMDTLFNLRIQNQKENMKFRPKDTLPAPFQKILGYNTHFIAKLLKAAAAARTDATVLIEGESGTGKELLARAIHESGKRKDKPFVIVNCAAIPEMLLESELFGYEAGSFTGASPKGKIGKFEAAKGGAIFLDEVADLPLSIQAKLLRAIQFKQIEKIGGAEPMTTDVRIIAATNKRLYDQVKRGLFREDLYYRFSVIPIEMIPLRERKKEDLFLLCEHFLGLFAEQNNSPKMSLSPEVISIFYQYEWPGNIRELKNAIEHTFVLAYAEECSLILPRHLPPDLISSSNDYRDPLEHEAGHGYLKKVMKEIETAIIRQTLADGGFDKEKAIKALGISRAKFYAELQDKGET